MIDQRAGKPEFDEASQANVEIVNDRQRFQADKDKEKDKEKEQDKEQEKDRDKEREEENKLNYYYYSSSNSADQAIVDNSTLIPYSIYSEEKADFAAESLIEVYTCSSRYRLTSEMINSSCYFSFRCRKITHKKRTSFSVRFY
ncbi:MAG: hypothetical protein II197_00550 [Peptococcaceae bacterium]|nr:hypothetical protein [Peptococcaceae bacterium]